MIVNNLQIWVVKIASGAWVCNGTNDCIICCRRLEILCTTSFTLVVHFAVDRCDKCFATTEARHVSTPKPTTASKTTAASKLITASKPTTTLNANACESLCDVGNGYQTCGQILTSEANDYDCNQLARLGCVDCLRCAGM